MSVVLDILLPLLVVLAMLVVGLSLTGRDFALVLMRPRLAVTVMLAQWLLPPVAGIALARLLALPDVVALGMVLVAAAPAAVMSNYYALLARANVALSVTVTAVSSIAATMTTPLAAGLAWRMIGGDSAAFQLPLAKILQQTLVGLLLPVLAGMALRRLAPGWVERNQELLQRLALGATLALMAFIIADQAALIRDESRALIVACLLFTAALLGAGYAVGWFASRDPADRRAILFGFPARNMAVPALVALAAFGRVDIAAFAAVFLFVQLVLLVPLAVALRSRVRPGTALPA